MSAVPGRTPDRIVPLALGGAGLLAAVLFMGRAAVNAADALRFGAWELLRLDAALCAAMLIPAAGLLPALQACWSALNRKGRRHGAALTASILIAGFACALGRSPGRILPSTTDAVLLAGAFVLLAAAAAASAGRRASIAAAWMVCSAFLLSCAWQAGVKPLVAYLFIR